MVGYTNGATGTGFKMSRYDGGDGAPALGGLPGANFEGDSRSYEFNADVDFTPVPEPSSALLVLAGVALAFCRRRR